MLTDESTDKQNSKNDSNVLRAEMHDEQQEDPLPAAMTAL